MLRLSGFAIKRRLRGVDERRSHNIRRHRTAIELPNLYHQSLPAAARDAHDDQRQAALWLVNTMMEQGGRCVRQILLTGETEDDRRHCRRVHREYGNWGTIAFSIAP